MNKKYFLYTRVSNDDYDKSIDNQKDILEKIAKEKGILEDVIKPYYEEHKS
jgi:DNA invertase Pin-like site-specific DNA recombinase